MNRVVIPCQSFGDFLPIFAVIVDSEKYFILYFALLLSSIRTIMSRHIYFALTITAFAPLSCFWFVIIGLISNVQKSSKERTTVQIYPNFKFSSLSAESSRHLFMFYLKMKHTDLFD